MTLPPPSFNAPIDASVAGAALPQWAAPAPPGNRSGPLPGRRPPRRRPGVSRRSALAGLALAGLYGVVVDLALRRSPASVIGAFASGLLPVLVLVVARPHHRSACLLLGAAAVVAPWVAWRDSPWLVPLDLALVGALTLLGASLASGGRVGDRMWVVGRLLATAAFRVGSGPRWAWVQLRALRPAPDGSTTGQAQRAGAWQRVGVPAARVLPVIALVLVPLGSGDALFASWFRLPVDGWTAVGHLALVAIGAMVFAGVHLVTIDDRPADEQAVERAARYGRDLRLLLGGLVVCLGAFLTTQAVAVLAGRDYVRRRTGLTYAEYARRGFFQLLAVAVITLVAVVIARRTADGGGGRLSRTTVVLGLIVAAETIGLVWVCVRRLGLYEHEYGLTMLRLYSTTFAWWIGAVVALAAAALVARRATWFVPVVLASAALGVATMNAATPERIVVRHQVAHARRTGRLDAGYLVSLSADAAPALAAAIGAGEPGISQPLRVAWCAGSTSRDRGTLTSDDAAGRNRARAIAAALRRQFCG